VEKEREHECMHSRLSWPIQTSTHILNMHPRAADGCLCVYTLNVDKLIFPPTQILYIATLYILHIGRKYHGVYTFLLRKHFITGFF
jgi:hypothetical protein